MIFQQIQNFRPGIRREIGLHGEGQHRLSLRRRRDVCHGLVYAMNEHIDKNLPSSQSIKNGIDLWVSEGLDRARDGDIHSMGQKPPHHVRVSSLYGYDERLLDHMLISPPSSAILEPNAIKSIVMHLRIPDKPPELSPAQVPEQMQFA